MKFLFYCDENEEAAVLQEMLSKWSGVSVESRAKQYGIPADVALYVVGKKTFRSD